MNIRFPVELGIFPVMLIGPWVNIIVRHGYFYIVIALFALCFFFLILNISHSRKYFIDSIGLFLLLSVIVSMIFSLIYHISVFGVVELPGGHLTFARFYGSLFLLSGFWLFTVLANVSLEDKFNWFAGYFFIFSFVNIVWGGCVLFFDFPRTWELMEHADYADGSGRPFGLTGNAAVNSTMLAVCYLFLLRSRIRKNVRLHWLWLAMLAIGVVVQGSGSGALALGVVVVYLIRQVALKLKLAIVVSTIALYFIADYFEHLVVYKISPRYIMHNYNVYSENVVEFSRHYFTLTDFLFGKAIALGETEMTADLGPLFIYNQMGIIFFIAVTLLLLNIAFRSSIAVDKYIIFIVLLTGIHYQSIFFLSSSFIFSMYIIVVITDQSFFRKRISYSMGNKEVPNAGKI